jgi:hypothetical protein
MLLILFLGFFDVYLRFVVVLVLHTLVIMLPWEKEEVDDLNALLGFVVIINEGFFVLM